MSRRFCGDCEFCAKVPYDSDPSRRLCTKHIERQKEHQETRGHTPDAYFTAPNAWVYVNSHLECPWFREVKP